MVLREMAPEKDDQFDGSLPQGYTEEPKRKCIFAIETFSGGYQGLAWAIILRAVEEGCSSQWLREICQYYGIDFDDRVFDRKPFGRVKLNLKTYHKARRNGRSPDLMAMNCGTREKLVLSWLDAIYPIQRNSARSLPVFSGAARVGSCQR
jgi:hypothetical protein